jgi:hypothetical protein
MVSAVIIFYLGVNMFVTGCWAANIHCLKRPESSFDSVTVASKSSTAPSIFPIRLEARKVYRNSLDIPSYRLCSKFDALFRLDLERNETFIGNVFFARKDYGELLPMYL